MACTDPGGKRGGQTEGQTQEGREKWAGRERWLGPLCLLPSSCRLKAFMPEYGGAIGSALWEAEGGDCLNYVGGSRLVE